MSWLKLQSKRIPEKEVPWRNLYSGYRACKMVPIHPSWQVYPNGGDRCIKVFYLEVANSSTNAPYILSLTSNLLIGFDFSGRFSFRRKKPLPGQLAWAFECTWPHCTSVNGQSLPGIGYKCSFLCQQVFCNIINSPFTINVELIPLSANV